MQPAPIRDTRRLRLVVGKTVGAVLLAAALAGCNYTANTGMVNPVAGPASSDPAATPGQPTTVDPPTVVPPVVVPPTPTIVPPQPEQATTCADSGYHSAGGNCARQPAPVVVPSKAASPPASSSGSSRGSVDLSALAAKVDPGLVDITSSLGHQNGGVAGTGIVLSSSGEVLTNNHVVSGPADCLDRGLRQRCGRGCDRGDRQRRWSRWHPEHRRRHGLGPRPDDHRQRRPCRER